MFGNVSVKAVAKNVLLLVIGAVLGALLMSGRPFVSQTASADTQTAPSLIGQTSPEGETWIACVPIGVANFHNRVHVQCAAPVGNISYFAAPTNNPAHVARVLSTISAAQVAGRTLDILYDPDDTSGTSVGCLAADCRLIVAVGFGQ